MMLHTSGPDPNVTLSFPSRTGHVHVIRFHPLYALRTLETIRVHCYQGTLTAGEWKSLHPFFEQVHASYIKTVCQKVQKSHLQTKQEWFKKLFGSGSDNKPG